MRRKLRCDVNVDYSCTSYKAKSENNAENMVCLSLFFLPPLLFCLHGVQLCLLCRLKLPPRRRESALEGGDGGRCWHDNASSIRESGERWDDAYTERTKMWDIRLSISWPGGSNGCEKLTFASSRVHQANPHAHQHHAVWTTTFRSGLPRPLSSQLKRRCSNNMMLVNVWICMMITVRSDA